MNERFRNRVRAVSAVWRLGPGEFLARTMELVHPSAFIDFEPGDVKQELKARLEALNASAPARRAARPKKRRR